MNTTSESPADRGGQSVAPQQVLVWDAPVRVFHWLMVLSFAGAWLTAESENWRLIHVTLGYTMAALVGFRIVWGLIGTRWARFGSFVRGPAAVARYVRAALRGRPEHHTGHNPAGALAIVALLALTLLVAATGWANYNEFGGNAMEEGHEWIANLMLGIVALHLAGVAAGSWLHRENLVASMITGRKQEHPDAGTRHAWRSVAVLLLLAVTGFWYVQWQDAPGADPSTQLTRSQPRHHAPDTDD